VHQFHLTSTVFTNLVGSFGSSVFVFRNQSLCFAKNLALELPSLFLHPRLNVSLTNLMFLEDILCFLLVMFRIGPAIDTVTQRQATK
jgi:hypothetical protein